METVANILDPIHATLAPAVWDHPDSPKPTLKPTHKKWIWHTVTQVLKHAGYTHMEEWLSLVLTGSLTTYQYSDSSDVDVSLFVDGHKLPEWSRAEMIGLMVGHVDGTQLPGTPYKMQCFVVASGITKADLYKPGLRSGYDILADSWIVPPDPDRSVDVEKTMNNAYVYAMECADKMERLLRYEPDRAIEYWHMIHHARQEAQKEGRGDYSLPNIVYKYLANEGLMPVISELTGEYIARYESRRDSSCQLTGEYIARTGATWDPAQSRWVMSPEEIAQINIPVVRPHWEGTSNAYHETGDAEFHHRVPVVYDGKTVYVGNPGDTHDDVYRNQDGLQTDGWGDGNIHGSYLPGGGFGKAPGSLTWFDRSPKPEYDDYIRNKLNAGPEQEEEQWFSSVQSARHQDRQVAKFVYEVPTNRLIVGQMGREEGEHLTHPQLVRLHNLNPRHSVFGQVAHNGWVETFSRPQFTAQDRSMNPYEVDYRLKQALEHAIPGVRWTNPPFEPGHSYWDLDSPPDTTYVGEAPQVMYDGLQPTEDPAWNF